MEKLTLIMKLAFIPSKQSERWTPSVPSKINLRSRGLNIYIYILDLPICFIHLINLQP